MTKTTMPTVTIHFADGTTHYYQVESAEIDPAAIAAKVEFSDDSHIVIQLAGRALSIPIHEIKSMEFTPVSPKLSESAMRNARFN